MRTCSSCLTTDQPSGLIKEYAFWTLAVAQCQRDVGTCDIILRVHRKQLADVSGPAWSELLEVIRALETALQNGLGATGISWLIESEQYDQRPHLPSHITVRVRPRYHLAPSHAVRDRLTGIIGEDYNFTGPNQRDEVAANITAYL